MTSTQAPAFQPQALADYAEATVEVQSHHEWIATGKHPGPRNYTIDHATAGCPTIQGDDRGVVTDFDGTLTWPCGWCFTDGLPEPRHLPGDELAPSVDAPQRGTGTGRSLEVRPASQKSVDLLTALARAGFARKGSTDEAKLAEWVARVAAQGQRAVSVKIDAAKGQGLQPMWSATVKVEPATSIDAAVAYTPERGDVHVVDGRYLRVSIGQRSGRAYTTEWTGSEWELAKGMVRKLSADTEATAEQAAAFGAAYSKCVFCTHDLDTPESISAGYGPVCAEKRGLAWG